MWDRIVRIGWLNIREWLIGSAGIASSRAACMGLATASMAKMFGLFWKNRRLKPICHLIEFIQQSLAIFGRMDLRELLQAWQPQERRENGSELRRWVLHLHRRLGPRTGVFSFRNRSLLRNRMTVVHVRLDFATAIVAAQSSSSRSPKGNATTQKERGPKEVRNRLGIRRSFQCLFRGRLRSDDSFGMDSFHW